MHAKHRLSDDDVRHRHPHFGMSAWAAEVPPVRYARWPGSADAGWPRLSGPGGHVGSEDVVGVPVEILARTVVAHRGLRLGVPGCDLRLGDLPRRRAWS
jgi:hypothetical protein